MLYKTKDLEFNSTFENNERYKFGDDKPKINKNSIIM
jgi:hypothetical protein